MEMLGSGAFGTVYKVIKTNAAGQYVRALKHIAIPTEKQYYSVLNSMGGDISKADSYFDEKLKHIISEIDILNSLTEKGVSHIVRYYENDINITDSPKRYDIYILMEYLIPLDEYMKKHDFSVRDVIKLGLDILEGLQACHKNGVIHRDIKEGNIFVSQTGEYKIGDFGISKVLKGSSRAESMKGTPDFLAPEVYLGKEGYTKSVDLYSLGIVLYRLLNYGRNPFLPDFPKQYYAEDEDSAFELRMTGKIPEKPSLGGDLVGQVIVKALLDSSKRFQTSEEFYSALEWAMENTAVDFLDKKIIFDEVIYKDNTSPSDFEAEKYGETLGETDSAFILEEQEDEDQSNPLNKELFEVEKEDISRVQKPGSESLARNEHRKAEECRQISSDRKIDKKTALLPRKPRETVALDKKVMGKFIFLFPVLVFLVGLAAYFVVLPKLYGRAVSLIEWLCADPQNILDTLQNPDTVFSQVHSIAGIRIFWWIWIAVLILSLFLVGRYLQAKPEPDNTDALLKKREPYFMAQEISGILKIIKTQRNNRQLNRLFDSMKRLEERLSVESDFGYGSQSVIQCENDIAGKLQFLSDTVHDLESEDADGEIQTFYSMIASIMSLLDKRRELKRR